MDNIRRHKRSAGSNKPGSMDGFLRPSSSGKGEDNPFARHRTYQPEGDSVGNFKRPGGFYPSGRNNIASRSTADFGRQPNRADDGIIELGKSKKSRKEKTQRKKARFGGRRVVMKTLSMVLIFGLISVGYLFGRALLNAQQTFSGGAAALEENINRDGRINILLLGRGGEGHTAPDLTDTIMLASIDPVNNEAALVSLPRDLYVSAGPYNGYQKLNSVYANAKSVALSEGSNQSRAEEAGLQAIQQEVSEVTGAPVHYYVMVDFKGFEKAIDVVGGVTIDVPEDLAVYENMRINGRNYLLNAQPGQQEFDGFKALAFSRSRMTSLRGDFDRSERQRLMLLALKDKVLSVGTFANPLKVSGLLNTLGSHVRTNLSGLDELARLYEIGSQIQGDKVESIGLADPPNPLVRTNNIGGLSVVVPTAGLNDYSDIHEFLAVKLRDGFLKKENAEVAVLNGTTTSGLATKVSTKLKEKGYTVGKVGDAATKNFTKTVIVDLSGGMNPKTKEYLEKRFNLTVVDKMPDNSVVTPTAKFVIFVGTDYEN